MKKQFVTRICPLCSRKLKVGDEDSTHTFYCQEFFLRRGGGMDWLTYDRDDYMGGKVKEPHYSVDVSDGMWKQSTIIPPYWIISTSESDTSRIYKFNKEIMAPREEDLLMEVPIIVPSDYIPELFARKIKNLVIFT